MKPRVLVVDDQPDIRRLLRVVLTTTHFEVISAEGGHQALEVLMFDAMPAFVLLDVQMPKMDGWETLDKIRELYGYDGPRVVTCTVKSHPRDLIHGWTSGCDGYVSKPFNLGQLAAEVTGVLARGHTERARIRRTAIGEAQLLQRNIS